MTRNELSAEQVIAKIHDLHGNVSSVARFFKLSRQTMHKYINDKPSVKAALEESREKMIDNVESALYSQALAGNTTAMIFFLKTQGKSRGYVERNELTGKDGNEVTIKVVYDE
jgi:hypothetical protein